MKTIFIRVYTRYIYDSIDCTIIVKKKVYKTLSETILEPKERISVRLEESNAMEQCVKNQGGHYFPNVNHFISNAMQLCIFQNDQNKQ